MGKRKQRTVIEEKKENSDKNLVTQKKLKKLKYYEKESTLITITTILFILDLVFISIITIFFSDVIIGSNVSHFEKFSSSELGVFVRILFLGIINGFILILITILLKRFFNKK